jgi:hypothetical protein
MGHERKRKSSCRRWGLNGYLVRSLKCDFPVFASQPRGEWGIEPKTGKQDFSFQIDGVNLQSGKARLIGNAGSADLTVITGDGVVNFIERTPWAKGRKHQESSERSGPLVFLGLISCLMGWK